MIYERLSKLDLASMQGDFLEKSREYISSPKAIDKVCRAKISKSYIFDPTYILDRDISMPDGTVIYRKEHKINPLDFMVFDRKLYFIDGRDSDQVDWLKQELGDADDTKIKHVILIGGSPSSLEEYFNREIYFDQFGELTSRFNIRSVPAIVQQGNGDKFLTINEVKI